MKVFILFLLLSVLAVGVQSNPQPMPVKVHLTPNLRRAAGSAHFYLRVKRNEETDSSSDTLIDVPLTKPPSGVFGSNLQLHIIGEDENGDIEHREHSPSQDELDSIEDSIFVHPASGSAVSVNGTGDEAKINGLLYNNGIKHNGTAHNVMMHSWGSEDEDDDNAVLNDYIELPGNITPSAIQSRSTIISTPEVWIFFDYDNSKIFNFDRTAILDYLGVFFHAMNIRYATMAKDGLKISLRLAGVTIVTSKSAQPFLERAKLADGSGYDISKSLIEFSYWSFQNRKSMKFDIATLVSGADQKVKNSDGSWFSSIYGVAYLNSACRSTSSRYKGCSVAEDIGGFYQGVYTVAHEIAHNMGTHHDGKSTSESCDWADGYYMGNQWKKTQRRFLFSPCSIKALKTYITSTQGSCLRSLQSSTSIPLSSEYIGDRLSMKKQCEVWLNNKDAYPDPRKTPDELCTQLSCRYPDKNRPGYYYTRIWRYPAGDNTPCGTEGGRCTLGYCKV